MAIPVAGEGGDFQRELPPEGRYNAVCVDVVDLGMVEQAKWQSTEKEMVPMVRITWALGDAHGTVLRHSEMNWPLTVSQRYKSSLHEKANLRKMLERWLTGGHKMNDQQLSALRADIERPLLGRGAEIKVIHSSDGKYANIDWVEPHQPSYAKMPIPTDYVRVKDREQQPANNAQHPSDPLPAHAAGQRADSSPFAQGGGDPFGGPAPATAAPRLNTYDDFHASPFEDDDDFHASPFEDDDDFHASPFEDDDDLPF